MPGRTITRAGRASRLWSARLNPKRCLGRPCTRKAVRKRWKVSGRGVASLGLRSATASLCEAKHIGPTLLDGHGTQQTIRAGKKLRLSQRIQWPRRAGFFCRCQEMKPSPEHVSPLFCNTAGIVGYRGFSAKCFKSSVLEEIQYTFNFSMFSAVISVFYGSLSRSVPLQWPLRTVTVYADTAPSPWRH